MATLLKYFFFCIVIAAPFQSCLYTKALSHDHKLGPTANTQKDLLPHYRNSLEWWYFATHLTDSSNTNYGLMFTVFKKYIPIFGHQIMVNYTVTNEKDTSFKKLVSYHKVKKKYYKKNPLVLQFENRKIKWSIKQINTDSFMVSILPKKAKIPAAIMQLKATKPIIKQTPTGYMTFGNTGTAGYLTYTRMQTNATLISDAKSNPTTGTTWFDKQWNCISIVKPFLSWKWTCIQFANNEELMIFNTYNKKIKENVLQGSYTKTNGEVVYLTHKDILWSEDNFYKSKTGHVYPIKINIEIPSINLKGSIQPKFLNHELDLNIGFLNFMTYWEGKCNANFTIGNANLNGKAFLEMTNMPKR